mmetsp:Transcript_49067/g.126526  ORF Transcript_49067/g.126526 Transcript_49067/m.126526 type:complete len:233 (-) Transcript_49067:137-835(-)
MALPRGTQPRTPSRPRRVCRRLPPRTATWKPPDRGRTRRQRQTRPRGPRRTRPRTRRQRQTRPRGLRRTRPRPLLRVRRRAGQMSRAGCCARPPSSRTSRRATDLSQTTCMSRTRLRTSWTSLPRSHALRRVRRSSSRRNHATRTCLRASRTSRPASLPVGVTWQVMPTRRGSRRLMQRWPRPLAKTARARPRPKCPRWRRWWTPSGRPRGSCSCACRSWRPRARRKPWTSC